MPCLLIVLATLGARASSGMVLTPKAEIFMKELLKHAKHAVGRSHIHISPKNYQLHVILGAFRVIYFTPQHNLTRSHSHGRRRSGNTPAAVLCMESHIFLRRWVIFYEGEHCFIYIRNDIHQHHF